MVMKNPNLGQEIAPDNLEGREIIHRYTDKEYPKIAKDGVWIIYIFQHCIDIYIDTNINAIRKLNATIAARLSPGYMVNMVVSW